LGPNIPPGPSETQETKTLRKIKTTLAELGSGATAADPLVGWRTHFHGVPKELLEIMRGLLTKKTDDRDTPKKAL
jgi:hypothetical protein